MAWTSLETLLDREDDEHRVWTRDQLDEEVYLIKKVEGQMEAKTRNEYRKRLRKEKAC